MVTSHIYTEVRSDIQVDGVVVQIAHSVIAAPLVM